MKKLVSIFIISASVFLKAGGFDDLGNSARAVSLGGAFTSIADASYSIFYNPAGLYRLKNISASTTYSNLYPGIQDDNINYFTLSGVLPAGILGNFGIGGTFLNTGLWRENTFIAGYSREIYKSFAVGGSVKLLRWSADPAPGEDALSYLGFTFDAGIHYTLHDIFSGSDIRFGMSARNITQPSIADNGSSDAKLPLILAAGFTFVSSTYGYLIAAEIVKEDEDFSIKTGAEFLGYKEELFGLTTGFLIRAGYNGIISESVYAQSGVNGGFGLMVEQLTIDYAYVFPLELTNVGGSHKISLSYNF